MKKIAFLLFFSILFSCNNEQIDQVKIQNDELTISSAKKWFEETELSKSNLRTSAEEIIEIKWDLAYKQKVNKLNEEAVIVPIVKEKKGISQL